MLLVTCTVGLGVGADFLGVLDFSFRANCDLSGDP